MRISNVVVGLADLERDDPALARSLSVCRGTGARLHVLHAVRPIEFGLPPAAIGELLVADGPSGPGELAEGFRERLAELIARAPELSGAVPHVILDAPASAIAAVAQEVAAELIVIGPTRRTRLGRALLGTTAGRVLGTARSPVLVVRSPGPDPPERVLLTSDLSELSLSACRWGMAFAGALAAAPRFRCILAAGSPAALPPLDPGALEASLTAELTRRLTSLAAAVVPVVRIGEPAEEILREAEDWGAGLIVLGTHGRAGVSRLLLGSTAEAVARDAACDVLVFPDPTR